MANINTSLFASTYGCGTYGSGTYNNSTCASSTTGSNAGSTTGNNGSVLTNTGFDLLLIATLAVTLIFIAFLVRFWKRPDKKPPMQESD